MRAVAGSISGSEARGAARKRYAASAFLYGLIVLYGSLAIGPAGLHFVPIGLETASREFLAMPYVVSGPDQRPDWIANLLMMVPLGYCLTGLFQAGSRQAEQILAGALAVASCWVFILVVKFAQLYFPPRTVTLNYVIAQGVGAALGSAGFAALRGRGRAMLARVLADGHDLELLLTLYAAALFLYFLAPFDFVIGGGELRNRLAVLPRFLLSLPGVGLPFGTRAVLILASIASTVPVGMLLALIHRERSLLDIASRGLALMGAVLALSCLVIGAAPHLLALVYRTMGIVLGAALIQWVRGKDLRRRLYLLNRAAPLGFLVYAIAVLLVSGVGTRDWRNVDDAIRAFDPRGLLPFWHYYIVSKAHAAKSLVVHAATYAPIGVLIWARRGDWRIGGALSAGLAFTLSLLVEVGRWMKPDLQPDFSDPIIAAAAAFVAFRLSPRVWRMLEIEARAGAGMSLP